MAEPLTVEEKELADVEVPPITLVAFDQKRYPVRKGRAIANSLLIKSLFDGDPDATEVPILSRVGDDSAQYMPQIVAFINHHDEPHPVQRTPPWTSDPWDRQFVEGIPEVDTLYALLKMANYMDIPELFQLVSARLVGIIQQNRRENLVGVLAPRGRELKTIPDVKELSALAYGRETVMKILTAVSGLDPNLVKSIVSSLKDDNRITILGNTLLVVDKMKNRAFFQDVVELRTQEIIALRNKLVSDVKPFTIPRWDAVQAGWTIVTELRELFLILDDQRDKIYQLDTGVQDAEVIKFLPSSTDDTFFVVVLVAGTDGTLSQNFYRGDRNTQQVTKVDTLGDLSLARAGPFLDTKVFEGRITKMVVMYKLTKDVFKHGVGLVVLTDKGSVFIVPVADGVFSYQPSKAPPVRVQFMANKWDEWRNAWATVDVENVVAVDISTDATEVWQNVWEMIQERVAEEDDLFEEWMASPVTWITQWAKIGEENVLRIKSLAVIDRDGVVYHDCASNVDLGKGIHKMRNPVQLYNREAKRMAEAGRFLMETNFVYEITCGGQWESDNKVSMKVDLDSVVGAVDVSMGGTHWKWFTVDNNANVMSNKSYRGQRLSINLYDELRRQEEDELRRQEEWKRQDEENEHQQEEAESYRQSPEGKKHALLGLLAVENPTDEMRMQHLYEARELGFLPLIDRDLYNALVERERNNVVISPAGSVNARDLYNRLKARMDESQKGIPVPAPQFGGDPYYRKYLKYKEKYLRLKLGGI